MNHHDARIQPTRQSQSAFFARSGWVYVLSNPAIIGAYKIGCTSRSIEKRVAELYTTGVPAPFYCVFAEWFADCQAAESFIHDQLSGSRINGSREFFAADERDIQHAFMAYSAIGESVPDEWVDAYSRRRRTKETTEAVGGRLVARTAGATLREVAL